MEEEMGVASAATQAPITIEEIVQLLMQGITPDELVQNGVPPELVQEAMMLVQQQVQAGQGVKQPQQSGFAGMHTNQEGM